VHRTGVAGIAFLKDRLCHALATDILRQGELACIVVEGRQRSHQVLRHDHTGSSMLPQTVHIRVIPQPLRARFTESSQGFRISHFQRSFTPGDNGSQVFAGHHQAHTRATIATAGHRNQARKEHPVIGSRAILQHFGFRLSDLAAQQGIHFAGHFSHQVAGIVQSSIAVQQRQVNRLR